MTTHSRSRGRGRDPWRIREASVEAREAPPKPWYIPMAAWTAASCVLWGIGTLAALGELRLYGAAAVAQAVLAVLATGVASGAAWVGARRWARNVGPEARAIAPVSAALFVFWAGFSFLALHLAPHTLRICARGQGCQYLSDQSPGHILLAAAVFAIAPALAYTWTGSRGRRQG